MFPTGKHAEVSLEFMVIHLEFRVIHLELIGDSLLLPRFFLGMELQHFDLMIYLNWGHLGPRFVGQNCPRISILDTSLTRCGVMWDALPLQGDSASIQRCQADVFT